MASVGRGVVGLAGALVPLSRGIAATGGGDAGVAPTRHHAPHTLLQINDLAAPLRGSPLLLADGPTGGGRVVSDAGGAARLLLVDDPTGGGRVASFPSHSCYWFKGFDFSRPQQRDFREKGRLLAAVISSDEPFEEPMGEIVGDHKSEDDDSTENAKESEGDSQEDGFCYNLDGCLVRISAGSRAFLCPGLFGLVSGNLDWDGAGCGNKGKSSSSESSKNGAGFGKKQYKGESSSSESSNCKESTPHLQKLEMELSNKSYRLHLKEVEQNKIQIRQEVQAGLLEKKAELLEKNVLAHAEERKKLKFKIEKYDLDREQVDLKLASLESKTADLVRREAKLAKEVQQVAADKVDLSNGKSFLSGERASLELEKQEVCVQRRLLEGLLKSSEQNAPSFKTSRFFRVRTFGKEWKSLSLFIAFAALTPGFAYSMALLEVEDKVVSVLNKITKAQQQFEPIDNKLNRAQKQHDLRVKHEIRF